MSPFPHNDPAFPQLALAVDPERMLAHLAALVRPGRGTRLAGCRILRVRHRRGWRCIVHYELTVEREGVPQTHWVAGTLYAERGELTPRLRKLWSGIGADPGARAEALAPFAVVPSLGMLLQRFPCDHKLPGLWPAGATAVRELEGRLHDQAGGDWRIESRLLEPVRWRVGLSAVQRYRVDTRNARTGQARRRTFYLKSTAQAAQGQQLGAHLARESGAGRLPFATPAPCLDLPQLGLVGHEQAAGRELLTVLRDPHGDPKLPARLADVLAAWHRDGRPLPRDRGPEHQRRALHRLCSILVDAHPAVAGDIEFARRMIGERLETPPTLRPAHLDLNPDHVFVDGDRLVLLDLDSAANADPMADLGRFLARLGEAGLLGQAPTPAARRFGARFLNRYRSQAPDLWLESLPGCYAQALLGLAVHLFEHQHPYWQEQVERLTNLACEAAGGTLPAWLEAPRVPDEPHQAEPVAEGVLPGWKPAGIPGLML